MFNLQRINSFLRQNRKDNVCGCIHKKENLTIPLHYMLPLMAVCCQSHTKWRKPSKSSQWNSVWSHWWKNSPEKDPGNSCVPPNNTSKSISLVMRKYIWFKRCFSRVRPLLFKRMRFNFWHFLQHWWGSSSFFTTYLNCR